MSGDGFLDSGTYPRTVCFRSFCSEPLGFSLLIRDGFEIIAKSVVPDGVVVSHLRRYPFLGVRYRLFRQCQSRDLVQVFLRCSVILCPVCVVWWSLIGDGHALRRIQKH